MNIYVIRNGQRFGPYTEQTLLSYVNQGQILVHDKAIRDTDTVEQTAGFYLRQAGLKCRIPNKGNIVSQLKSIGSELIFPKTTMLIPDSGYCRAASDGHYEYAIRRLLAFL